MRFEALMKQFEEESESKQGEIMRQEGRDQSPIARIMKYRGLIKNVV